MSEPVAKTLENKPRRSPAPKNQASNPAALKTLEIKPGRVLVAENQFSQPVTAMFDILWRNFQTNRENLRIRARMITCRQNRILEPAAVLKDHQRPSSSFIVVSHSSWFSVVHHHHSMSLNSSLIVMHRRS
jgi:hypothetical protein